MLGNRLHPVAAVQRRCGFTLIELLVVLAVLAVLASMVVPRYLDRVDDAREVVLKQNLIGMRTAIDQFYRDKGQYPETLDLLVKERYIRAIPTDPLTSRPDTWITIAPKGDGDKPVFDVRSGASGQSKDGSAYGAW